MTASATSADIKAFGELTVGPLFSRKNKSPSNSRHEKDDDKRGKTAGFDSNNETDHDADLLMYTATFETNSDNSFYTPIETQEEKHR